MGAMNDHEVRDLRNAADENSRRMAAKMDAWYARVEAEALRLAGVTPSEAPPGPPAPRPGR